jgi:hypothetical protein
MRASLPIVCAQFGKEGEMKKFGSLWLGMACIALMLATSAQAHTLTKKKALAALKPVAAEVAPTVAPAIAAKLPGATIAKSGVGGCEITKKGHRAGCVLSFTIQGASTGETECGLDALVQFRSKKSKQLKVSVGSTLVCLFPVPLE